MNSTNSIGHVIDTTAEEDPPPPPEPPQAPAKPNNRGRPKGGWPSERSAAKNALVQLAARDGECPQCGTKIRPMTLDLVHELVRASRDEVQHVGGDVAAAARMLYLAARLDGFCGTACYRKVHE